MYQDIITASKGKMDKTIARLNEELQTLRAGRANPKILDRIMVDYFGVPTPIAQVGSVAAPEPRLLVITPWDPKLLGDIEKAIFKSDIGITPSNDGKVIRLSVPELTGERRKELTKQVQKMCEESKVAVRSIRRDAIDQFKKMEKASEITEDDRKKAEEEMQKVTDAAIKELEKLAADKEREITTV